MSNSARRKIVEQYAEIESLRQQLAAAKETDLLLRNLLCVIHRDGGHHITAHGLDQSVQDAMEVFYTLRDLPEQLAAALAACEAKDALFDGFRDNILFRMGVDSPYRKELIAPFWERAKAVLAIKPDASILKAHDEALIERCAAVCDSKAEEFHKDSEQYDCQEDASFLNRKFGAEDCAETIRSLIMSVDI